LKTLRWSCLILYTVFVVFVFYTVFSGVEMPRWWFFSRFHHLPVKYSVVYAALFVSTLAAMILATSTGDLVKLIGPKTLLVPAAAGSVVVTALLTALFAVLEDLLGVQTTIKFFIDGIIFNWIAWFIFFYIRYQGNPRFRVMRNLAAVTLLSGFFELVISAAAHLSVRGRVEWFLYHPGMSTSMSLLTGLTVMVWSLGLGVVVLFFNERYMEGYNKWRREIIKERGGDIEDI
jgi:hypothetical protein